MIFRTQSTILLFMASSIVQALFFLALGSYIIQFARSSYSRPELVRARWFSHLPAKKWSLSLLRSMSVFWIFGALILISQAVTVWPAMRKYHGSTLVMLLTLVAAVLTAILVSLTPKQRS